MVQWYEMTPNYPMTMERYPNLNRGVGGSISDCGIFSLLYGKIENSPTAR
jgi:hypothetical protein